MQLYHSFTSTQLTASINAPIAPITTNNISILILCIIIGSIGPIIPYLAKESGTLSTNFSYLLALRAYGMLFGAIILKYIQEKKYSPTHHNISMFACIGISITSFLFASTSNTSIYGLCIFLGSICYIFIGVKLNVSTINLTEKKHI